MATQILIIKLIPLRKPLRIVALGVLCLGLITDSADAITLTVSNTNDSGAGSLRQALNNAAATGDEIVFAAGVSGTITLTSGELSIINKNVTITGPGAANLTISGNNASRVIMVINGAPTLSGLRIANGRVTGNPNANNGGGGIYNNNGKLTLRNCEIADNVQIGGDGSGGIVTGGQGGGIWHVTGGGVGGGRLLLQNCVLSGNRAIGGDGADGAMPNGGGGDAGPGQGGALFTFPSSVNSVTLQNCTFMNNSAIGGAGGNGMGTGARGRGGRGQGGAIFIDQNNLVVAQHCTFKNNDATGGDRGTGSNTPASNPADGQGGAFYVLGFAVITGCTLDANKATGGPGIDGSALIGAPGQGGGLFFAFGAVNVSSSTVINNVAEGGAGGAGGGTTSSGEGGGLFIRFNSGTLNSDNSTVANNTARAGNADGTASGGGIWTQGTLNVNNSTVAFNVVSSDASDDGGGISVRVSGGTTTLRNTLVAKNVADIGTPDASGPVAPASSYNLIGIGSGVGGGITGISNGANNNQIGTSAAPIDPKMRLPALNGGSTKTCSLEPDSPAVNAGNDATAPTVDQRGCVRLGVSDIGAFEFLGVGPSLKILSITRLGSGPIVLEGLGVPNSVHRIQASPDLSPGSFFDLATATAGAGGPLHYEDAAAGLTKRFYRLAFP